MEPSFIDDICVGNVLQPGAGAAVARMAMFEAGFPESVPCYAINRQCASGLQAIANIAGSVTAGHYEIGIAAGVESITQLVCCCYSHCQFLSSQTSSIGSRLFVTNGYYQ